MQRLLYISHRLPYPPDKGERLRAYHQIRALAERFEVTLASLVHGPEECVNVGPLKQLCQTVLTAQAGRAGGLFRGAWGFLLGRSITQGYFHNPELMRQIRHCSRSQPFDVAFGYCSSMLPYLQAVAAKRLVLDLVDVDSLKWRAYARGTWGLKRWLYAAEARRVAKLERRAVETCHAVLLVSRAEVDAFHARADNVHAVGNGVDTEYFHPMGDPVMPPRVVFTGTMSYAPNVEGVRWFCREVWPAVRRAVPNVGFDIVGRDPAPAIRRLDGRDGIRVTGTVDDVRPYLAAATCAVCPLLTARGIQNKILEALAMARPVIATPAAAEGLDRLKISALTIVKGPEWLVEALVDRLADPKRDLLDGLAAAERIRDDYSWSKRMAALTERFSILDSQGAASQLPVFT